MALSVTIPGKENPVVKVNNDDPRMPEIRLQERQQEKRIRKIRRGFRGTQHNWLLLWVQRKEASTHFDTWIKSCLSEKVRAFPESIYSVAIDGLLASNDNSILNEDGTFIWEIDESHRIVALPEVGLIAFFAPPGNLRKAIDPTKTETSWNWSISGAPFSETNHSDEESNFLDPAHLKQLQDKFGVGGKSVLGIIDTGICPNNDELKDRVIATWAIKMDRNGVPRPDYGQNWDEIGHGTEAATIAAGKNFGIAKNASIFSLKIPMRRNGSVYEYHLMDLAAAFHALQSDHAPAIDGNSVLSLLDTLLLPSGMYLSNRARPDGEIRNIVQTVAALNSIHNIIVVAAIGNIPQKASFPADEPTVLSVGALDATGSRWQRSGSNIDRAGRSIPVIHFPGCNIACQSLNGLVTRSTGTSMAAAGIAGIVSLLAHQSRTSRGRWQIIRNNIVLRTDSVGQLPVLSFH